MRHHLFGQAAILAGIAFATSASFAEEQENNSAAVTIVPTEYLALPAVGQYGRLPLHRDALEAQLIAASWKMPADGDVVETADGRRETWQTEQAAADGSLDTRKLRGGYALAKFESPDERVMLLEAAGHAMVYVNGEPRAGDPYALGWLRLPVLIRQGLNTLLFHLAADRLSARLMPVPHTVHFAAEDRTLPTLVRNETADVWAAIPIINATTEWLDALSIESQSDEQTPVTTPVSAIPPLSLRKAPFQLRPSSDPDDHAHYEVRLLRADGDFSNAGAQPLDVTDFKLDIVGRQETHVRTFLSRMDGSVQPYAVRPASEDSRTEPPGTIVALHAAGDDCASHIANYAAKPWAHIVAPQGRRPYGFDWEAWSRTDVLEALSDAQKHYVANPRRTYLTGHSMGGHGAWHLGVTYPDRFAAIGPSSGWISFWSYGGGMPSAETPTDVDALLLRGYSSSDTLKLLTNLTQTGVYVLHGAGDQSVPAAQARFMRSRLAAFHPNFVYFEEPNADHWWGDECCDWPRMMEFFRYQTAPNSAQRTFVDFTTGNPGVSSRCDWVGIEAQKEQLVPSHIAVRQNPDAHSFVANTTNVARLSFDVAHLAPDQPIDVTLDGQELHWLPWPGQSRKLWFEREGDEWSVAEAPSPQLKGPNRYGTFNSAFDHNVLLVYGTAGNEEENHWAAAKAQYDAETFYYRGGGTLELLPDNRFDMSADANRNVILYGNADTNRAWPMLLAASPVEVRRGQVRVGTRTESGDDLAVLMVRPRAGSDQAMVGVVGGTGLAGMRLTDRLRWFVSGVVYPDLMVVGPKFLSHGTAGVRAWGYFGLDWQIDGGEIAWRDPSQ